MNKKKPLKPPGAGLPPIEAALIRHAVFPLTIRTISRKDAINALLETGHYCINIASQTPIHKATQPTLIPRLRGLEDSSRNWSIIMTIEHLLITGRAMRDFTIGLASKQKQETIVRIEDVKPIPGQSPDNIIKDYQNFLNTYEADIAPLTDLENPDHTHAHPWFGELTAHDWLALNAAHHDLHMRQIKAILKRV